MVRSIFRVGVLIWRKSPCDMTAPRLFFILTTSTNGVLRHQHQHCVKSLSFSYHTEPASKHQQYPAVRPATVPIVFVLLRPLSDTYTVLSRTPAKPRSSSPPLVRPTGHWHSRIACCIHPGSLIALPPFYSTLGSPFSRCQGSAWHS
jgi:hypothetical protein